MAGRSLSTNIAASAANVLAVVGVSLVSVPLLVDRLGLAGYGLWALAQSLVIYVTTAELGFGPALARFTSIRAAQREHLPQVLVAAVAVYGVMGVIVVVACHLLAAPVVALFDVPAKYHDDAVTTVGLMGWVSLAALAAAAFGHMLSGLERFRTFTLTNALGSVVFLAAVLVLPGEDGAMLTDIARAALLQWTAVAVARLISLNDVVRTRGRRIPELALVRELVGFSARLQISVLATLFNTQTDRIVVGLVASATTLGQVSIATQLAEASRFLGYSGFTPMASRMATTYASAGADALRAMLRSYRDTWVVVTVAVTAVAASSTRPAIEAWLGPGHDEAALFAAVLLVGYGVGMLPSTQFAARRALGEPGLEGTFGVVTVVVNICASVVFGLLFGAIGVVCATAGAYLLSTAWVFSRMDGTAERGSLHSLRLQRLIPAVAAASVATYVTGQLLVDALPRPLAFAGIGLVCAVMIVLPVVAALGRPRR